MKETKLGALFFCAVAAAAIVWMIFYFKPLVQRRAAASDYVLTVAEALKTESEYYDSNPLTNVNGKLFIKLPVSSWSAPIIDFQLTNMFDSNGDMVQRGYHGVISVTLVGSNGLERNRFRVCLEGSGICEEVVLSHARVAEE